MKTRILGLLFVFIVISSGASCKPMPTPVSGSAPSVSLPASSSEENAASSRVPEEPFSFAFTWNTFGISSYDSETGRLVKTSDATHPENYVTTLFFSEEDLSVIRQKLGELDLFSYPDTYDPYNAPDAEQRVVSKPSRTLCLSVRQGDRQKTIYAGGICIGGTEGYDEKATAFLTFCQWLQKKITDTPEWKALPEYEFFYD